MRRDDSPEASTAAATCSAAASGLVVGGASQVIAIAAGGKPTAELGAALLAEVTRLATTPPTPAELAKVKTQIVTGAFISRQTPLGLASAIADAAVLEGNAARINTDLDDLQRVTAADVQRVLRRYVLEAHKVTIEYRQQEGAK